MRARNIKPAFFQNELLAEVDPSGRLLFIGLWTLADREGRLEDRPRRIKMQLFALDDVDIDALLNDLEERGFIQRYERDGGAYIQIVNFKKHQRPHNNEAQSVIPPPMEAHTSNHGEKDVQPRATALRPESLNTESLNTESLNTESLNTDSLNPETGENSRSLASDAHAPKRQRPRNSPVVRERDATWDALAALCGEPETASERADFGKTVKQLREARASPEDIAAFGPWWWQAHPDAALTHRCLRHHWGRFRNAPPRPPQLSDIRNPHLRSIATVDLSDIADELEGHHDSRARLSAQNGGYAGMPAPPGRISPGERPAAPDVLPAHRKPQAG